MSPRIIAHRGASVAAPENTFAAFELAVELGATSLELDVDVTRDGHLVVLHDSRFDRGFEGRFPEGATRIPTLAEVLDFAVERGLWVNVETKDYSDDWAAVNELVGTAIRSRDLAEQTLVSSIPSCPRRSRSWRPSSTFPPTPPGAEPRCSTRTSRSSRRPSSSGHMRPGSA